MSEKRDASTGWRIHSARTVHETRWLTLREYHTTAPTGAPAVYTIVCPKNLAVGIVPIFDDGSVPLVGQSRFTFAEYSWELPEGGGPLNADALTSAQRELAEETGLQAKYWLEFLQGDLSNSITDERSISYLCWGLEPATDAVNADQVEDITVRRVRFADLAAMADAGEITDGFTLLMVYKVLHMARSGALPAEVVSRLKRGGVADLA